MAPTPKQYVHLEIPDRSLPRDTATIYPTDADDAPDESISLQEETRPHNRVADEAIHAMVDGAVKLVSMLNFMKVELGNKNSFRSKEVWRSAGAEFVATMLFVFLGCGSVVASGMLGSDLTSARLLVIAIGHGLAICFLAGAVGAISGGHINPAVTVAFVVGGKENILRASLYIAAQLFGSVIGAFLLWVVTPHEFVGGLGTHSLGHDVNAGQGFVMEFMLTFVLIFVIFGVAVDRRGPGVIAPIPIGFAVLVDHLVGVPYTGASMNPARSFGPALISGHWTSAHWIYWLGPCLGGAVAGGLYKLIFLEAPIAEVAQDKAAKPK